MATIDDKATIDAIIAANGRQYDDEPSVVRIVEYTNLAGNQCWGVVWAGETDHYRYERPTAHVRNPRVIFTRGGIR